MFYNLAVRINRRVMYHANDRAHDLLAQSTKLATQQPSMGNRSTTTQSQLLKGHNADTNEAQQAKHYHSSAPSQP